MVIVIGWLLIIVNLIICMQLMVYYLIMKVLRRGPTFVIRKISRSVARIQKGYEKCIFIGNLDAQRY